jgi:chromosome segregation ATPase
MAQERVTITGDIKDEPDLSDTTGENMLVGTVESTSEPVEAPCLVDGRFKDVIQEKGSLLSQTWTDLFALMNQYEAELLTKSGEMDIRAAKLQSEESRLNLSVLKSSEPSPVIAVLQQDNVEKDEKIMTYMGEINSLEKELAELRNEFQLKDFHIQTLERELTNKDTTINNQEERIKVLDQRVKDLSSEVKNKDFVISQVSKQVRSMASPGRARSRKRPNLVQSTCTGMPVKVMRLDDSTSAISLRVS